MIRILIVEGDRQAATEIGDCLSRLGYQIAGMAASGNEAIATARQFRPDLALVNILLNAQKDGITVARQIWTTLRIPVIYLTDAPEQGILEQTKATHPFGYIFKPVEDWKLHIAIETAMQLYQTVYQLEEREKDLAAALQNSGGEGRTVLDGDQQRLTEERRQAVERARDLELQMEEIQHIAQLKDDFLSMVSHELRTPLANMKMAIQMLEIMLNQQGFLIPEQNPNAQRTTRYLEILRSQCTQELNLVNDLLNLQQLNADAYSLVPALVYLQDWIPTLVEHFQERMQENGLRLALQLADVPPIQTDEASLSRILRELLNNACKYTPAGETITVGVYPATVGAASELTAELELDRPSTFEPGSETVPSCPTVTELQPPNHRIVIQVSNTGVEITARELASIFDQFYRIPHSDFRNSGGTGLGLALTRKLVNYLGGSIRVESYAQQTNFFVELPLRLVKLEGARK
jgi:signal transduction histidine kinase